MGRKEFLSRPEIHDQGNTVCTFSCSFLSLRWSVKLGILNVVDSLVFLYLSIPLVRRME